MTVQKFHIFFYHLFLFILLFFSLEVEGKCKIIINNQVRNGKNKSVMWGQLLNKIKEIDPEFGHSKEQITRKCLNLRTMFKRMKQQIPLGTRFFFLSLFLFFTSFCFLCISQ